MLQPLVSTPRQSPMFVHHKGATLIPNARRESVPAFQSHAIVHTQHLPCHSPVPWLHRLSFTHHHPTFSAKISCGQGYGIRPHGSGRIGGLGLPGRALLAPGATCPKIQLPCLVTGSGRASPGLSHHTQNKQSLLTGREVRAAKRRRPLHLEGGQHAHRVSGPMSSKSMYAVAILHIYSG